MTVTLLETSLNKFRLTIRRRFGSSSSSRRFEIAASRRERRPPPVSTSTLRATKNLCHSRVRPVPTWTRQSLRFCPLFRALAPSAVGEGSKDSPKQEDRKNESRTSKTDRKQGNRAIQSGPGSGPQGEA